MRTALDASNVSTTSTYGDGVGGANVTTVPMGPVSLTWGVRRVDGLTTARSFSPMFVSSRVASGAATWMPFASRTTILPGFTRARVPAAVSM